MRGLTNEEVRCLEQCLPGSSYGQLDYATTDVANRLLTRGLVRWTTGPDDEDDWYVATPMGVCLFSLFTKGV